MIKDKIITFNAESSTDPTKPFQRMRVWTNVEGHLEYDFEGLDYSDIERMQSKEIPTDMIDNTLQERQNEYGDFDSQASIAQELKAIAHKSKSFDNMDNTMREGLEMILHKIARILNGNPSYIDSWLDIEGYARLVRKQLEKK